MFRIIFKQICKLPRAVPNVVLHMKEFYGLVDLVDHLRTQSISSPMNNLNSDSLLGDIFAICLTLLQSLMWISFSPLYINSWSLWILGQDFKSDFLATTLHWATELGISFVEKSNRPLTVNGGDIPLIDLLEENYSKYTRSFRSRGVMFLTQILSVDNKKLLRWEELKRNKSLRANQGSIPQWYKELFFKLCDDHNESPLSMT